MSLIDRVYNAKCCICGDKIIVLDAQFFDDPSLSTLCQACARARCEAFARAHALTEIAAQATLELHRRFEEPGTSVETRLSGMGDEQTLVIDLRTPLDVDSALARWAAFREEWWTDNAGRDRRINAQLHFD